jgi:hypothetical protein
MANFKYFFSFILITLFGYLYEKYRFNQDSKKELQKYDKVKNFLFDGASSPLINDKPFLWVHNNYTKNSRWWPSFYSRTTENLNQPYLQLCLESLVRHCGDSFNI